MAVGGKLPMIASRRQLKGRNQGLVTLTTSALVVLVHKGEGLPFHHDIISKRVRGHYGELISVKIQ